MWFLPRLPCWWTSDLVIDCCVSCFLSAVWLHFSGSHQDFQDGETCQLCCHLSHYGSCKWLWGAVYPMTVQKKFSHKKLLTRVNQVVMGGGQEAMEVTTTSTRIGKFEARWGNVWLRLIWCHKEPPNIKLKGMFILHYFHYVVHRSDKFILLKNFYV